MDSLWENHLFMRENGLNCMENKRKEQYMNLKEEPDAAKAWLRGYLDERARMESLRRVMDDLDTVASQKPAASQKLETIISNIHETLLAREAMISRLEDARQRTVLTLRYIEGLQWNRIAQLLCYEAETIYRAHRQALREIQRMMTQHGNGAQ
jgi:DNA-directed RNA polymerase specialized sigma24 family protein